MARKIADNLDRFEKTLSQRPFVERVALNIFELFAFFEEFQFGDMMDFQSIGGLVMPFRQR
jgi:hypothetical protein